jgi:uncharacterized iron-regulated membrane protein
VRTLVQIHRWLSLVLGLPVALVAITGLPLAFWEQTDAMSDPAFYPDGQPNAGFAINRAVALVRNAHPDAAVHFVYFPRAGTVMHVGLSAPGGLHREVAVDSAGTRILGVRSHEDAVIGQLYAFHANFFAGAAGRWAMLLLGWSLLVSTLSGAWIWLKRSKRRADGSRSRTSIYALHNTFGIWSAVLLVAMAATTIALTWPSAAPNTPAHEHAPLSNGATLDTLAGIALDSASGATLRSLSPIDEPGSTMHVIFENRAGVMQSTLLDRQSADVVSNSPLAATSTSALMRGLHTGSAFGHLGRWAMAAGSILPMMLWLTGLWMMLLRKRVIKR